MAPKTGESCLDLPTHSRKGLTSSMVSLRPPVQCATGTQPYRMACIWFREHGSKRDGMSSCPYCDTQPQVNAPVPGIGFHIRWHGLWMEVVDGI